MAYGNKKTYKKSMAMGKVSPRKRMASGGKYKASMKKATKKKY